jgi:Family of unknown function (DUF6527)
MKSTIRHINDHGVKYDALLFVCPGCVTSGGGSGLHMLAINNSKHKPSWTWNWNLESPTLSPSILTKWGKEPDIYVCHSFLKAGVFQFLSDSTHKFAGQFVPIPDLPGWAEEE